MSGLNLIDPLYLAKHLTGVDESLDGSSAEIGDFPVTRLITG